LDILANVEIYWDKITAKVFNPTAGARVRGFQASRNLLFGRLMIEINPLIHPTQNFQNIA
jgi:hypothetical protein